MKPLFLKIMGINSVEAEQTVDFKSVGAYGLFGIFGPTGSGKSTILDAITLSLYGKIARYSSERTSGFINDNSERAYVSFEFKVSRAGLEEVYLAERSYGKNNKKAGYTTTLCRLVKKTEFNGTVNTEVLADKDSDVTRTVEEIIGLNYKDFTRCLILPQGKFNEFLMLTNKERRDMLERVFHLDKYGESLYSKVRAYDTKNKNELAVLNGRLTNYDGLTTELLDNLSNSRETLKSSLKSISEESEKAVKRYEGLRLIQSVIDELNKSIVLSKNIDFEFSSIQNEYQNAQDALSQSSKRHLTVLEEKDKLYPILLQKENQLKQAVELSNGLLSLCKERDELLILYKQNAKEIREKRDNADKLFAKREQTSEKINQLSRKKAAITINAKAAELIYNAYDTEKAYGLICKNLDEMAKKAETLNNTIKNDNNKLLLIKEKIKEIERKIENLTMNEKNASAASLASGLLEGVPCPVCGSVSHPCPAPEVITEIATEQNLKQIQKTANELLINEAKLAEGIKKDMFALAELKDNTFKLESEKNDTSQKLDNISFEIIKYMPKSIFNKPLPFKSCYEQIKTDNLLREQLESEESAARLALDADNAALERIKSELATCEKKLEELKAYGIEKTNAINEKKSKITSYCGDSDPSVLLSQIAVDINNLISKERFENAKKLENEKRLLGLTEKLAALTERKNGINNTITQLYDKVENELLKVNFSPEDLNEINSELVKARNIVVCLNEKKEKAEKEYAVCGEQIRALKIKLDELSILQKEKKQLEHKSSLSSELCGLFYANSFVDFAAVRHLKYITFEASKRLKRMTNGKFALELYDTEFVIRDDFNGGARRSPSGLSGGELFMTSLCLALALSAKIQMGNKANLGFFFLDEGFGTLDNSCLDIVVGTLEQLKDEKITVGLISHVEDLKLRVVNKILVEKPIQGVCGTKIVLD